MSRQYAVRIPRRSLTAMVLLCGVAAGAQAAPTSCTCRDLPALVKEIIEQEWLGKRFREWSDYMPRELSSPGRVHDRASAEFNAHFYPNPGKGSAAGTQDGGHAALGTLYDSDDCAIGVYQYNKKGNPINKAGQEVVPLDENGRSKDGRKPPKDNEHHLKPTSEDDYMKSGRQCEVLVRYAWVHEQHHQSTCQRLKSEGRTKAWDSMAFFARNDAEAYKAGADYLRQKTKQLAAQCGWEGSTGENAVPTPDRARELAQKGSKAARDRAGGGKKGGGKNGGGRANGGARIMTGTEVEVVPMHQLLERWDAQCSDLEAPGCGALGVSIEAGLVDLFGLMQRRGGVERPTLFDAAHADSVQLKVLAMRMMHNAQNAEETELALALTEHPSPGVREAARGMLQGSEDARWQRISKLWKSPGDSGMALLVPDLPPRAEVLGVETLQGLRHLPFAGDATTRVFSTREAPDAVVKRVFKGREVMANAKDMESAAREMEGGLQGLQEEMMRAAQSGDIKKMNELTARLMEMQQKLIPSNPMAVNNDKDSIGILLEKDSTTGAPVRVARVRHDEDLGETTITFERIPGH